MLFLDFTFLLLEEVSLLYDYVRVTDGWKRLGRVFLMKRFCGAAQGHRLAVILLLMLTSFCPELMN